MLQGSENLPQSKKPLVSKILVIILAFILLIVILFLLLGMFSQPLPSQPEVLSYEGHTAGYGYVVYVTLINNGADGWVKATVEGISLCGPEEITTITYSQRTYLKNGESGTLQFVFEYFINNFEVHVESITEGGPPEISVSSGNIPENITSHYIVVFFPYPDWIGWQFEMKNKENASFQITFINFTYEGDLVNGSKVYSLHVNITNIGDQATFGSPLPSIHMTTKSSHSYGSIEVLDPYFKPMDCKIDVLVFVIPESEIPYWVSWSEGRNTTALLTP